MKPSDVVERNRGEIRRVVEAHWGRNPRIFGSVLHGDDGEGSDLDLLIDAVPGMTLMDLAAMQLELEQLLGVPVDVHTRGSLPEKFRAHVVAEAVPV